ncbi:MAG: type II toxin-antitoxin system PemK/MazF family toxin [Rhodoglobus sp.]
MRPIHLATIDKVRPAIVLTREVARPHLTQVTVIPITSRVRGIATEIPVGRSNGLDHDSAANVDGTTTINIADLGQQVGFLLDSQEEDLLKAIHAAFDLDD